MCPAARAEAIARRVHEGQVGKAGNAYNHHPERVAGHVVRHAAPAWLDDGLMVTRLALLDAATEGGSSRSTRTRVRRSAWRRSDHAHRRRLRNDPAGSLRKMPPWARI